MAVLYLTPVALPYYFLKATDPYNAFIAKSFIPCLYAGYALFYLVDNTVGKQQPFLLDP